MMKNEFLTLRANMLGGMDDYIHNVIDNPHTTAMWKTEGIGRSEDLTEDDLIAIADSDKDWTRACYIFGNLIAGFGN